MVTRQQLYEALRATLGDEVARLMADAMRPAVDLVTKPDVTRLGFELRSEMADLSTQLRSEMADLSTALRSEMADLSTALRSEMAELRTEMRVGFEQLRAEIKGIESSLMRWMLTFFVPLWLGVWAVVLGLVLTR